MTKGKEKTLETDLLAPQALEATMEVVTEDLLVLAMERHLLDLLDPLHLELEMVDTAGILLLEQELLLDPPEAPLVVTVVLLDPKEPELEDTAAPLAAQVLRHPETEMMVMELKPVATEIKLIYCHTSLCCNKSSISPFVCF